MTQQHLVEMFREAVKQHGATPAMKYKRGGQWHTVTYDGLGRFVRDLAGGLLSLGLEKGERVAMWSANSPEWVISDYAILSSGAISVPVYDTLTGDQAAYTLNDCGARFILVENEEKLDEVLGRLGDLPDAEAVVMMGPMPDGYEDKDGIYGMDELYAKGRAFLQEHPDALDERIAQIEAEDLASFVYTSGTTGDPKGVMLTHHNFASNVRAVEEVLPLAGQVHLGFLPLCHSFARIADQFVPYSFGSTVCFAESIDKLTENMQEVHPTVMSSVPRLYEKMHSRILEGVQEGSPLKQKIFHWALGVGSEVAHLKAEGEEVPAGLKMKMSIAHALVFKKLDDLTGGRLQFFVSGGAALSKEIQEFFASAGIWIMQGYGMTETSPVISANSPENFRFGSVGKTVPGVDVRLDEDNWHTEGEGEIQVQGPNVTQGYYKLPDKTDELFTEDGWLRTGDVGRIDEDGFLYITDRVKQIFKTAYGKYIVPNKLEAKLKAQNHIAQVVIIGESKKYVSALLAPDFERLEKWANENGVAFQDHEDLVENQEVKDLIWSQVEEVNQELARYEQLKRVELLPRELTVEEGELTPTLKVKMRVVEERWADKIDALRDLSIGDVKLFIPAVKNRATGMSMG
ncbi:MAG: long-chain fatty acid--CoA ligase, partial [Candidatus Thermoplasmatota archaeon]|nr:long-chain fatty acid--CoA ligase [Candidatus Thermoplasmatota archaeon]